jgi:hypothetical protein
VLLARLEIMRPKTAVADEEYLTLSERARFKCPLKIRDIRFCDTRCCPARPDNPSEDYSGECIEARYALQRLRAMWEETVERLKFGHRVIMNV